MIQNFRLQYNHHLHSLINQSSSVVTIYLFIFLPAQFADDGLGRFAQVRRILQHSVQNFGINLLRLRARKRRADRKKRRLNDFNLSHIWQEKKHSSENLGQSEPVWNLQMTVISPCCHLLARINTLMDQLLYLCVWLPYPEWSGLLLINQSLILLF